jgi:hypothetical protein
VESGFAISTAQLRWNDASAWPALPHPGNAEN